MNCPSSKLSEASSLSSKKNWYSTAPTTKVVELMKYFTPASGPATQVSLVLSP